VCACVRVRVCLRVGGVVVRYKGWGWGAGCLGSKQ
jgi:hypothetical protein